jgi:hypothetical protein
VHEVLYPWLSVGLADNDGETKVLQQRSGGQKTVPRSLSHNKILLSDGALSKKLAAQKSSVP